MIDATVQAPERDNDTYSVNHKLMPYFSGDKFLELMREGRAGDAINLYYAVPERQKGTTAFIMKGPIGFQS